MSIMREMVTDHAGQLDPNRFSNAIMESDDHHIRAIRGTGEIIYYKDGAYYHGGEEYINELIETTMNGVGVTIHKCKEIVQHVRRRCPIDRVDIDARAEIINMVNGLYNMDTGELMPHTPEYPSMRRMGVLYDEDAVCHNIDRFIKELVAPGDVVFVYELFYYMLLKSKVFRTAVFMEGRGRNGKSVLMKLMERFVGDVVSHVAPNQMGDTNRFARAELYNKLLNIVDDLGNEVISGTGAFKSVISNDVVRAEEKHKPAFSFTPTVLCIFGCNEVPKTTDTTDGYFDRMRVLNFPNVFRGKNEKKHIIDELTTGTELAGLFNKAMSVGKALINRGDFTGTTSVEDKRRVYLCKSNNVHAFIAECCELTDKNATTPKDAVYDEYVGWCECYNLDPVDMGSMTTVFKGMGHKISRFGSVGEQVNHYKGVTLC